jgi:single-stranded-DNA-specific exonuclease
MNALQDYWQRFFPENNTGISPFFTALTPSGAALTQLPYLMGIELFCQRVSIAIDHGEKICIYADYDADAVTATATMYWGLIWLGVDPAHLSYYAPDRFTESYGINTHALEKIAATHTLIITVDCGISAVEQVAFLNRLGGCDILITDHHQIQADLPDAYAIINPQLGTLDQDDPRILSYQKKLENNPSYTLLSSHCGTMVTEHTVGVGTAWFCVVWLAYYLGKDAQQMNRLLPFVAIGTIADCQSVVDTQNRVLVQAGLQVLNRQSHHIDSLDEIVSQMGFAERLEAGYGINSIDLGFSFGPLLNAPGRIAHAHEAIAALTSTERMTTTKKVAHILQRNEERKAMVKAILTEVEEQATIQYARLSSILWLEGNWNKGIIGLVASRLSNQYALPTIVLAVDPAQPEKIAASLRAPAGYNLAAALQQCSSFLSAFGGHLGAAGCTIIAAEKELFASTLAQIIALQTASISPENTSAVTLTDIPPTLHSVAMQKNVITLSGLLACDPHFAQEVWKMDPFGQDFPLPLFLIPLSNPTISPFGSQQQYSRIQMPHATFSYFGTDSIDPHAPHLWVLAKPSINYFRGVLKYEYIVEKYWTL